MSNIKYQNVGIESEFYHNILSKTRLTNKVSVAQVPFYYYFETTSAECMICADGGVKLCTHWH